MARTRAPHAARPARAPQAHSGAIRARLSGLQRSRILAASADVTVEHGAASVTVAHIVERSGVSRRTFYEQFADREDCLLAAFEQALELASERVLPAFETQRRWRERIRAGLAELLAFVDEQPLLGRLLIVESLSGGTKTLVRRSQAIARITAAVDAGREEAKDVLPVPLAAEGIVGGALTVIHSRLTQEGNGPLIELLNQLMGMIVLPYLGVKAARRELDRPLPMRESPTPRGEPLGADPFKEAGMRFTYRTVRVLMAVVDNPGASNRAIGKTAGIADQGQISKLLGRLRRIGLVSNTGLGPGTGAPNAWTLTDKGREVVLTIRGRTEGTNHGDRVA